MDLYKIEQMNEKQQKGGEGKMCRGGRLVLFCAGFDLIVGHFDGTMLFGNVTVVIGVLGLAFGIFQCWARRVEINKHSSVFIRFIAFATESLHRFSR